jgi:signal transduction histidine kinase
MPESPSSAVPARDDAPLRGRLLWLVATPAGAAALLFAVTAGYLWADGADRSDLVPIVVLLVGVLILTTVAGQAVATIRRLGDRPAPLRVELAEAHAQAATARADLADARAELADARAELTDARAELADARAQTTAALTEAAGYRAEAADARAEMETLHERVRLAEERPVPVRTSAGRQVEVFVNLSRRLQSLVHREIKLLDALENEVEDPDLLKGLFQVDHLATRIRRHAENLAVLGGAVSRRQWSRPVALTEVLRSAIAEVEHYSRVKLVPPIDGTVPGHAVASIIHLVAELIENATMFAPPQTQVLLRAQHVTAGVVIEVEDRGLGMQREDQERVNRLLLNPEDINLDELLQDGRIGLFVVSMIARQHGVTVQLQGNIYGGTQAVIVLPQHLLGSGRNDREPAVAQPALTQNTMELAQRVPGPSQIAAPPPTWPAFATDPALAPATPAPVPAAMVSGAAGPAHTAAGAAGSAPAGATPAESAPAGAAPAGAAPAGGAPPESAPAGSALWPTGTEAAEGQPAITPPPLPRRHSQTHLAPQLQFGPPPSPPEDDGEHDPGLMASFMQGVSRSEAAASPGHARHGQANAVRAPTERPTAEYARPERPVPEHTGAERAMPEQR